MSPKKQMNRFTLPAIIICCAAQAQAAIPEDIDRAFSSYMQLAKDLAPVLAEAKDKATADAAAEKLNALLPRVYDARNDLQKIERLSPEVQQEVLQQYGKTMQQEWGKVYEQIFRLERVKCYASPSFFKQFRALCMMLQY